MTLVTRWRADEIAAGVSDLGSRAAVLERPEATFLLWPRLHAKYYRFDDETFVGSSNITGRGLGWVQPANLELLERVDPLLDFEGRLLDTALVPDDELEEEMREAASLMRREVDLPPFELMIEEELDPSEERREWIPRTRQPEALFEAYSGGWDTFTAAARRDTAFDLSYIDVPPGLSKRAFESAVRTALLSDPLLARLDRFLAEPRRFGEVRQWLSDRLDVDREQASAHWQTIMRWMLFFAGSRYERSRPGFSEVLRRRKEGGGRQ